MQVEEFEGTLGIAGDDREPVSGIENQLAIVLDETPQPVEHEFKLTDPLKCKPHVSEWESRVEDETINDRMSFGKANGMDHSHEEEEDEERLLGDSDADSVSDDFQPQTNNDVLSDGLKADEEQQELFVECSHALDKTSQSETTRRIIDSSTVEEFEAPSVDGRKGKTYGKGKNLANKVGVEARFNEGAAGAKHLMHPEEAKGILDIVNDVQQPTSEIRNQRATVFKEVPKSVEHEFAVIKWTDRLKDGPYIEDCESEVVEGPLNRRRGFGKVKVAENLHQTGGLSPEHEKGVEEHFQDASDVEYVGSELQPQTNDDFFRECGQVETTHGSVPSTYSEVHGVLPTKDGKKKKQRKGRHNVGEAGVGNRPTSTVSALQEADAGSEAPQITTDMVCPMQSEGSKDSLNIVVDDQDLVSEIEDQMRTAFEEDHQPAYNDFVVNGPIKECESEVQGATADELKSRLSEHEEGERRNLQNESDVEGVGNEMQPQMSKDFLKEYKRADLEPQEHPAEGCVTLDEIDQSEYLQRVVDMSSAEEFTAPSMKGKKKKHQKRRNFKGEADVQDRPASCFLAPQEIFSMETEVDLKSSEVIADVGLQVQLEAAEDTPKIRDDDQEIVSEIKKQPVIVFDGISQSAEHEFVISESTDQSKGEPQIKERQLEAGGGTADDRMDYGKTEGLKNSHGLKAPSVGPWIKKCDRGEEEEREKEITTESTDVELQPEEDAWSQDYPTEVGASLSNFNDFEAIQDVDAAASSVEPEALLLRKEKRKKQHKIMFPRDEGAVRGAKSVVGSLKSLNIAIGDKVSSSGGLEEVSHSIVVKKSSEHEKDVPKSKMHAPEVQNEIATSKAIELEPFPVEQEKMLMHHVGESEKWSDESDAGGKLQPQLIEEICGDIVEEGEEPYKIPARIGESANVLRVDAISSHREPEAESLKGGKRTKRRKKWHLKGETEAQKCAASTVPASQEISIMADAADFKASKEAVDVRCQIQPEEDKSPQGVEAEDGKSVLSAIEEVLQSNKQKMMGKYLPDHMEDGTESNQPELEISDVTVGEPGTIFHSGDSTPFCDRGKQLGKQNKKPNHREVVGELWHNELHFEGLANATQPQTDEEDVKKSADETVRSQERPKEGGNTGDETVESEAIQSDNSLPSLRKLDAPSANRKKTIAMGNEQYQGEKLASLLEEQPQSRERKANLRSSADDVNDFRDAVSEKEPFPELTEVDELRGAEKIYSTFNNQPISDEAVSAYPKFEDSLDLGGTGFLQNSALEYGVHMDEPKQFDLTESKASNVEASQPRLAVEEVQSNQKSEKSGRMETLNSYSDGKKLSSLWVPTLIPPTEARETVEGEKLEFSSGSIDQLTIHEPKLENLIGERSQIADSTATVESMHSPDVSGSAGVDDPLSLNLDENLPQADDTMEVREDVSVTEYKSIQKQASFLSDISNPLGKRIAELTPLLESKECSGNQGRKMKQPKEKLQGCRKTLEVVDVGVDESPPHEQQTETTASLPLQGTEASLTKQEKKRKKHQRGKREKDVHLVKDDSKSLPSRKEAKEQTIDKRVREAECVPITSTSTTPKEESRSFAEQMDDSTVRGVSSNFDGRSSANIAEMELQKESIAESDVRRTTGDGTKKGQEDERLKCPVASVQETVDPNRIQVQVSTKVNTQRAKELGGDAEPQGKDEVEPKFVCQEDTGVDEDRKEPEDADNLADCLEGKDESSVEEPNEIKEMEPRRTVQEFDRNPTGMASKVQEAKLSLNLDKGRVLVAAVDKPSHHDEEEVMNSVESISNRGLEPVLQSAKGIDGSGASLNYFIALKPPENAMQRNEGHQGSEYAIPATTDLETDKLQQTDLLKVARKGREEEGEEEEESSSPHFDDVTPNESPVALAGAGGATERESSLLDEYLGQAGSDLLSTDLSFSQEPDRSKQKHWKKGATENEAEECLTPVVEVDKSHLCIEPVVETNVSIDAHTSKVFDMNGDLLNKEMPQPDVEISNNTEFSPSVDTQDVEYAFSEPDSVGGVQETITNVKSEEAFSPKSTKMWRKKGETEKAESVSASNSSEVPRLSKSRQRCQVNLQEMEKGDEDVTTGSQHFLSVEAPVEDIQSDATSTPREGSIPPPGSLTRKIQLPDVVTSLCPPSSRKTDVERERYVETDVEIGRQVEVESAEEADEDPVTSADHSFAFLEQSSSDTDEVDDFTVVVKAPPPKTIVEVEAPAEPIIIPPSLQIRVKPRRWRWPGFFLLLLLFFLFFFIPTIILFCIASPDFCFLPGPCPGLTLRQRINAYITDYHRQRMSPFPT
ncbi:hypothetical protein TcWFU_010249 [Taenia crassiceps]|uniref:Uncharacterized protein n=1 Tax=Taenia crassiceps TaxID=6207 RepID=A0ABR4Q2E3_9CEST